MHLNKEMMSPYNLHVGDRTYVKHICFWPVKVTTMDDNLTSTKDGDLFDHGVVEPVYLSRKIITVFSLACKEMTMESRQGGVCFFRLTENDSDKRDFCANSTHLSQHRFSDIKGVLLKMKLKGAGL